MGRKPSLLSSLILALGTSAVPRAVSGEPLSDRDCQRTLAALEGSSAEVARDRGKADGAAGPSQ